MKRLVLGIHGFIGSGKSYAATFFEKKGAFIINADRVVDDLYKHNRDGYLHIKNYFGDDFITSKGEVNKKKLAKFVFADPKKLKILHYIIHPLVTNEVQKILDANKSQLVVLEATYFEEKHLLRFVNKMLWIEADAPVRQARVLAKGNVNEKLLNQIQLAQKKYLVKHPAPDFIVENNGDIIQLDKQLEEIWLQMQIK